MKPTEIRIGNYVNVLLQPGSIVQVNGIDSQSKSPVVLSAVAATAQVNGIDSQSGVMVNGIDLAFDFEDIYPIPIDEDWLFKFGFTENRGVFTKSRKAELGHPFADFSACFYDDTQMKIWLGNKYIGIIGSCGMVHQFQNLFFALTAIELTHK